MSLAVVGLLATWALAADGDSGASTTDKDYLPDARQAAAEEISIDAETARVVRTLEQPAGEVRWTLVSYLTSDGRCRDWVAEQVGGSAEGMLGECGDGLVKPFSWSIDGIELGGQWYNVISGTGVDGASKIRITLADGSSEEVGIDNGVWLTALPGPNPAQENRFDVKRIEAIGPVGAILESAQPPSVRKSYEPYQAKAEDAPTH